MTRQMRETGGGKAESALFLLFLSVLVWAPLPFASNRVWAGSLLALLLGLVFAGWLVLFLLGRASLSAKVWQWGRLPLILLVAIQLWVALQLVPLPALWVEFLSPRAVEWHLDRAWITLSLDPQYGKYYLVRGAAYTVAFFLTLALVNSEDRLRMLLQTLVFSGTFQAVYGSFMVLSGLELGFFVEKYAGQGVATGTFVNRNHLAGYLVMCLAAGTALMMSQLASGSSGSWRERTRNWLRLLLSPRIRLRIFLAVMVIALVLTRSRTGNLAFFASLALAGGLALYTGRRFSPRLAALLASLFLVDMVILGRWFGFDKVLRRLEETNPAGEGRVWSNEYALDYLADFPLTGSGAGSFYGIFPNYQGSEFSAFHQHAHNDYLEFAVELGIPALVLLAGVVCLAFSSALAVQRKRRTAIYRGGGFAVTMTIFWVMIHSATDFNLQIPANALTFVTLLAVAFVCRGLPGKSKNTKNKSIRGETVT